MKKMPFILKFAFIRVNALRYGRILLEFAFKVSRPIIGHPSKTAGKSYIFFLTEATYAPWKVDSEFQEFYKKLPTRSVALGELQLYDLWNAVKSVKKIDGDIMEVGVWRGTSLALLGHASIKYSPNKKIHGFDTFAGVALASENDPLYVGGEHADTSEKIVRDVLADAGVNNAELHIGIYPVDSSKYTPNKISLAHIDVDTYDSTILSLEQIWGNASVGARIVCTDYGSCTATGVPPAVEKFVSDHDNAILVYSIGGSGIVQKISL